MITIKFSLIISETPACIIYIFRTHNASIYSGQIEMGTKTPKDNQEFIFCCCGCLRISIKNVVFMGK